MTLSGNRFAAAIAAIALVAAPSAAAHDAPESPLGEWSVLGAPFGLLPEAEPPGGPEVNGRFGEPFEEPTIAGARTEDDCVTNADGSETCKPAAGSLNVLPDNRLLYWDALEGQENSDLSMIADGHRFLLNDQTRLLELASRTFSAPEPPDGGANPGGGDEEELIPGLHTEEPYNDGALFCSDQVFLADGRVLAVGGSHYYAEPGNDALPYGVIELEGLKSTRIFDPETNRWTWTAEGDMKYGRWYPTLVELPDGKVLVASGVSKLLKPVYPERPLDSGRNVTQTETYDPASGRWSENGARARKSLPLYPRLHLLPNGHVFYAAAGQAFNPFGQAYDEPTWAIASVYDPKVKRWRDLGVPGLNTLAPGFRGSTFSIMLPLKPDSNGTYTKARFLAAGGVLLPTPGSYLPTDSSTITTVDTAGPTETMATERTGPLSRPRWYSTGVLLPTGQVLAFSGADRDAVASPGVEMPIRQAEMFDPATKRWRKLALGNRPRTYHNTAALLPDGRVVVAGHAPIATMYLRQDNVPGFAPNRRDPSFEIYSPPYLFKGGRPRIEGSPSKIGYGGSFGVGLGSGADIDKVVLTRNTAITHLVDANQRAVELDFEQSGANLQVKAPPRRAVAPPGPYLLWVVKNGVPSVARQVAVG